VKRFILLLSSALFTFLSLSSIGCANAGEHSKTSVSSIGSADESAQRHDTLLAYDFSQDIETQVFVDFRGASDELDALIGIKALTAETYHPEDELILGVKHVGSEYSWTINETIAHIAGYVAVHKAAPEDALDLQDELVSSSGYNHFFDMYFTQRMTSYGPLVNLATNKFYKDFDSAEWRPGGVYVELLAMDDSGAYMHDGELIHLGDDEESLPNEIACYYKVFSAKEGCVLFEDYFVVTGISE